MVLSDRQLAFSQYDKGLEKSSMGRNARHMSLSSSGDIEKLDQIRI